MTTLEHSSPLAKPAATAHSAMAGGQSYALASWGQRVLATILDGLFYIPIYIVFGVGLFGSGVFAEDGSELNVVGIAVAVVSYLAIFVFAIYQLYLQGKTGSTWGKSIIGIALIKEENALPTGFWYGVARNLLHMLDGLILNLGYLLPLIDAKRQTIADKVVRTIVVRKK